MNPYLIKELRQLTRSKVVSGGLVLLLFGQLLAAAIAIPALSKVSTAMSVVPAGAPHGMPPAPPLGLILGGMFGGILGLALCLVLPLLVFAVVSPLAARLAARFGTGRTLAVSMFLIAAGAIMVFALITSKKARKVINTSVSLSRQDAGEEIFSSSRIARSTVRSAMNLSAAVESMFGGQSAQADDGTELLSMLVNMMK